MKINKNYLNDIIKEETELYISQLQEGVPKWAQIAALLGATWAGREYGRNEKPQVPIEPAGIQQKVAAQSDSTDVDIDSLVEPTATKSTQDVSKDKKTSIAKKTIVKTPSRNKPSSRSVKAEPSPAAKPAALNKTARTVGSDTSAAPLRVTDFQSSIRNSDYFNGETSQSIFTLLDNTASSKPFTIKPGGVEQRTTIEKECKKGFEAVQTYLDNHPKLKATLEADEEDAEGYTIPAVQYKKTQARTKLAQVFFETLRISLGTNQDNNEVMSAWKVILGAAKTSDVNFSRK